MYLTQFPFLAKSTTQRDTLNRQLPPGGTAAGRHAAAARVAYLGAVAHVRCLARALALALALAHTDGDDDIASAGGLRATPAKPYSYLHYA